MYPSLLLISALAALAPSATAHPQTSTAVTNPLTFVTWPCDNCAETGPPNCIQTQYQASEIPSSDVCYALRAPAQSLKVYFARDSCELHLYDNADCTVPATSPGYTWENPNSGNEPCRNATEIATKRFFKAIC